MFVVGQQVLLAYVDDKGRSKTDQVEITGVNEDGTYNTIFKYIGYTIKGTNVPASDLCEIKDS